MRLIDLHCNWALQYTDETSQYPASLYRDVGTRLGQVDGYLTGTGVTVLTCGRRAADWAKQPDAWTTIAEMITRYEAEFSGRLLIRPDDILRRDAEPAEAICWGVLGIEGFDFLVRTPDDLDRLPVCSIAEFESFSSSRQKPVSSVAQRSRSMIGACPNWDESSSIGSTDSLNCQVLRVWLRWSTWPI